MTPEHPDTKRPTGLQGFDPRYELEQLYRAIPMSLALLDRDHRFVRVNASFAALDGLSIDEHIGRKLDEIFPDLASRLEPMCRRVFESGHPVLKVKVVRETLAHPEQKKTWHISYHPLKDSDETVQGVYIILQDITERVQIEEDLQRLREERARIAAEATTGALATLLIEELTPPLTAILSNAQAAQRFLQGASLNPDEVREILADIIDDDRRATEVMHRLLGLLQQAESN